MQSAAKDVTAYLEEAQPDRRECLQILRALCLEMLPGYEESMEYGMPCYKKDGVAEVGFASQKNYISFNILKREVIDANREALAGLSLGKGCIRYPRPARMDFDVVRKLLAGAFESRAEIC